MLFVSKYQLENVWTEETYPTKMGKLPDSHKEAKYKRFYLFLMCGFHKAVKNYKAWYQFHLHGFPGTEAVLLIF